MTDHVERQVGVDAIFYSAQLQKEDGKVEASEDKYSSAERSRRLVVTTNTRVNAYPTTVAT